MNQYDFTHDFMHTTGWVDEDLDYELPDPMSAMHYKKKRSQTMAPLGIVICFALLFGYPIFGLKMPQRDNPFFYRFRKYASGGTVDQFQRLAVIEYGDTAANSYIMPGTRSVKLDDKGFRMVGKGLRIDLENNRDLIC